MCTQCKNMAYGWAPHFGQLTRNQLHFQGFLALPEGPKKKVTMGSKQAKTTWVRILSSLGTNSVKGISEAPKTLFGPSGFGLCAPWYRGLGIHLGDFDGVETMKSGGLLSPDSKQEEYLTCNTYSCLSRLVHLPPDLFNSSLIQHLKLTLR